MTSFKKLTIQTYANVAQKETEDSSYWKKFEFPIIRKEFGAVSYLQCSPALPHDLAITAGAKVQLYSQDRREVVKSISHFKDTAYSCSFRKDGQLLIGGSADGIVRVFDVNTRGMLRWIQAHSSACQVTKFTKEHTRLVSAGDDKKISIWDLPTSKELKCYTEHDDYIRCGAVSHTSPDIFVTGGYDHRIFLWDARSDASVLYLDHGSPVESVLLHPAGGILVSAGDTTIKVWDILAGGRMLLSLTSHYKTVTCLTYSSNCHRLLSASLDRQVKVHSSSTYQMVHSMDFPSSILSMAMSPDDNCLAVGMADGLVSIQLRKKTAALFNIQRKTTENLNKLHFHKKQNYLHTPNPKDFVIKHYRKPKLEKYDKFLKNFEYSKALDVVMNVRIRETNPDVVISVCKELIHREGMTIALAGLSTKKLGFIIKFIGKHIRNPKYMNILIDMTNMILEEYHDQVGANDKLTKVLRDLNEIISSEVIYMNMLMDVIGSIETLVSVSSINTLGGSRLANVDAPQIEICDNDLTATKADVVATKANLETEDPISKSLLKKVKRKKSKQIN